MRKCFVARYKIILYCMLSKIPLPTSRKWNLPKSNCDLMMFLAFHVTDCFNRSGHILATIWTMSPGILDDVLA